MAATYGWPARRVETELTDELLVLYLDEAADRLGNHAQARFDSLVEAVRAGTIFAHNGKAHASWTRKRRSRSARGLVGAALEQAVGALAMTHPEYVVQGTA